MKNKFPSLESQLLSFPPWKSLLTVYPSRDLLCTYKYIFINIFLKNKWQHTTVSVQFLAFFSLIYISQNLFHIILFMSYILFNTTAQYSIMQMYKMCLTGPSLRDIQFVSHLLLLSTTVTNSLFFILRIFMDKYLQLYLLDQRVSFLRDDARLSPGVESVLSTHQQYINVAISFFRCNNSREMQRQDHFKYLEVVSQNQLEKLCRVVLPVSKALCTFFTLCVQYNSPARVDAQ